MHKATIPESTLKSLEAVLSRYPSNRDPHEVLALPVLWEDMFFAIAYSMTRSIRLVKKSSRRVVLMLFR